MLVWRADTREQGDEWEQDVQCEIHKESIKHLQKEIGKSNYEEIIFNYMKIFYYTTHLQISNISK